MFNSRKRLFTLFPLAFLFLIVLSSCDTKKNNDTAREELLKQRIDKLWNARIATDKKTIYTMTDNAYRKKVSEEQFLRMGDYQVAGFYEIVESKLDPDKNTAQVIVKYKTMQMGYMLEPKIMENWLFENGEWKVGYSMRRNPFTGKPN